MMVAMVLKDAHFRAMIELLPYQSVVVTQAQMIVVKCSKLERSAKEFVHCIVAMKDKLRL